MNINDEIRAALQRLADGSAEDPAAEASGRMAREVLAGLERLAGRGPYEGEERAAIHRLLNETGRSRFLRALGTIELLDRWAAAAFRLIRFSDYSLLDLFLSRVREHPARILFQDMAAAIPAQWSYEQVERMTREIAAAFLALAAADGRSPRAAIFSDNSLMSACADLACLFYDILDAPLNTHFGPDELVDIFNRLGVTMAVTDTAARRRVLEGVRARTSLPFTIVVFDEAAADDPAATPFLGAMCATMGRTDVEQRLASRRRLALNETATAMFTSGSTGRPKGVSFSNYQMTAKRFARAAALPEVGGDEVFLSFLPFYHTFGRFLEMLGSIYWSGTYVFPGNTSAETLFALFPRVQPTGFISVPIRWTQLHERCQDALGAAGPDADAAAVLRGVLGGRLRWGLSAAGYLDPKVFRFFEKHGVLLASGFGMTEGTGGITMTVPGCYVDNAHGRPLPGVQARLSPAGELQVRGDYIARYLEDAGPGAIIPYPENPEADYWLSTGDVFAVLLNGYYQIVDRVKDIYKNTRGETVAPLKVENKFIGVPGIKRTFLVGDGRPTNVLFIVPDYSDEVLQAAINADTERAYYRRIVGAANLDLAPYERVVNFALLDRDFDAEHGELTAKGSYNRKRIEADFAAEIEELYKRNDVEIERGDIRVRIPLWFFRDLGVLEDEIFFVGDFLFDSNRKLMLPIVPRDGGASWIVGDLEYRIPDRRVDLGLFARQPRLWLGNPALVRFCPCKPGWDVPIDPDRDQVSLPDPRLRIYPVEDIPRTLRFNDAHAAEVNALVSTALLADDAAAVAALEDLDRQLSAPELRSSAVIRRRLEALSRHPAEAVRCAAYRILLLDEPNPEYNRALMSFLYSGRTFLNQDSIEAIASSPLGQGRFDAVRRRMYAYREDLPWPVSEATRAQLAGILRLFVDFARYHPEFFRSVRAELASWILHRRDLELARAAGALWTELNAADEGRLAARVAPLNAAAWDGRIVFDEGLSAAESGQARAVLTDRTFLIQTIDLIFDSDDFNPADVPEGGIWVSRLPDYDGRPSVRVSVNTRDGRHFDIRLVLGGHLDTEAEIESVHWHLAIANYPLGQRILPRIGSFRPEAGALALFYSGELSVWERIRLLAAERGPDGPDPAPGQWRRMFIEGMAAFFKAWRYSSRRIVPGLPAPTNVMVPSADFREEPMIHSLAGRTEYVDTLSLIRPLLANFYRQCEAHYPWSRGRLDAHWIFDACYEALGYEGAAEFFSALRADLERRPLDGPGGVPLARTLRAYIEDFRANAMIPLPALNAIARFKEWQIQGGSDDADERERKVLEVFNLYRLDRYPEVARYHLYRHTYFAGAPVPVRAAFDGLLARMGEDPQKPAVQLLELSDLQAVLLDEGDRLVFSQMVFPRLARSRKLDIMTIGGEGRKRIIVQSTLTDAGGDAYSFGETYDPAEIGQLYRLFFKENYPKSISEQDRHYVLRDSGERVAGGLCFRMVFKNAAFIDGIVVAAGLKGRGLGGTMVDDFCQRMAGSGVNLVLTNFFLPDFFVHKGFKKDKRWGALVRDL
jgi:long-chain acyl-CoA synthetase